MTIVLLQKSSITASTGICPKCVSDIRNIRIALRSIKSAKNSRMQVIRGPVLGNRTFLLVGLSAQSAALACQAAGLPPDRGEHTAKVAPFNLT